MSIIKDRSRLCAFTFADGRQCRTPRRSGHPHLCYFHAQKEAQAQAAKQAGEAISSFFYGNYLSACDLSAALGRVFSAVAEGHIKPKAATALAYLGQTLNQSVKLAQDEYANVYGGDVWRRKVASYLEPPPPPPQRLPQPAPTPQQHHPSAPQPTSQPAPASASAPPTPVEAGLQPGFTASSPSSSSPAPEPPVNCRSPLATHHSPLPPSPLTPLPPTSAEFAQQVLAGLNSSRSQIPTLSGPAQEVGSSVSSSSPVPSCASSSPDSAQSTTPAPASPPKATPRSPLATSCTSPDVPTLRRANVPTILPPTPPVPPGFGAPANWDALIRPKPRRRFSRHWQLPE